MCGISGVALLDQQAIPDRALVERMRDRLVHRGPDGAGTHLGPGIGLGHRRLSIVDVAHGQQPMYSENGRFVIVYNGEVFNHPHLKRQLEATGIRYRTRSDTETVLHLYEQYGPRCVEHMRGMFAFAVWDNESRILFLARDRFGVKPLYYAHRSDGSLFFGSEIKALVETGCVTPELNLLVLPDYLANHAPSGSDTLFQGIRRLPPAHTLTWQAGRISIQRYWDLYRSDPFPTPRRNSPAERRFVEEYRERFTEAVRLRLMSDVPLGTFLSGGIDSAAITATMATLMNEPVRTFSVAFAEREANELQFARLVAERFRTRHHEVTVSPRQFFARLPHLVWHEDEPLAHPSSVALNFVSELAAQHVKVVLTGEGSDEVLAGYNRYRVTIYNAQLGRIYQRLMPVAIRRGLRTAIGALPRSSRLRTAAARTFILRGADLDDLYFDNFAVFGREAQRSLLARAVRERLQDVDPYLAYHDALDRTRGEPLLDRLLYADTATYLQELLMKQDQMSMASSIESRVPFLDHVLVEWTSRLPVSFKLRGATTKWILRAAMHSRLPTPILRRRKMGFPVPVGSWLRGPWRHLLEEYVISSRALGRGLFEPAAVRRLVQEHDGGLNHSERLWALLNFEMWARLFLDRCPPSDLPIMSSAV